MPRWGEILELKHLILLARHVKRLAYFVAVRLLCCQASGNVADSNSIFASFDRAWHFRGGIVKIEKSRDIFIEVEAKNMDFRNTYLLLISRELPSADAFWK